MSKFGHFKVYGDLDEETDVVKMLGLFRQAGITVSMDVALYEADRFMQAIYPNVLSLLVISDLFIESVSAAYGGFPVVKRELIISTKRTHVEILHFNTGRQFKIEIHQDIETFEVLATATRVVPKRKTNTHEGR